MSTFERIKKLSKKLDKNLQEVAMEAGLGKNAIYKWQAQNPKAIDLAEVAKVLNTTTDYLLGRTDDPTIPNNSENHINSNTLTWLDLDMPYGGSVPDELKDYYKAMAEQYIKQHPEILEKRDDK